MMQHSIWVASFPGLQYAPQVLLTVFKWGMVM